MQISAFDAVLDAAPGLRKDLVSHVRMGNLPVLQHADHGGRPVVKTGSPRKVWTRYGQAVSVDGSSAIEVDGRIIATSGSGPLSITIYMSLDVTGSATKYAFGQSNSGGTVYVYIGGFTGDGTGGTTNGRQYISFGFYNSGNGRIKHCYFPSYVNKELFMFTGVMDSATAFRCYLNGNLHDAASFDYVYGLGNSMPSNRTDRWGFGQVGEFTGSRATGLIGEALVHRRALSAEEAIYLYKQFGRKRFNNTQAFVPTPVVTVRPWYYYRQARRAA